MSNQQATASWLNDLLARAAKEGSTMKALFKKLGTTDEVLECDCCGNQDLRSTVVLEHIATGETVYFGSVCAAAALHPWAALCTKYAMFEPAED